jgi:hypothetical protein
MKESYGEGLASHAGPESCAGRREAAGEALTGVHADQPLSSEIKSTGTPTLLSNAEGNIEHDDTRESCSSPAESKTLRMRGNSLHGNREVPSAPTADGAMGRSEQAKNRTSDMYADGRSDGPKYQRSCRTTAGLPRLRRRWREGDRPRGTPCRRPWPGRRAGTPRRSDCEVCEKLQRRIAMCGSQLYSIT